MPGCAFVQAAGLSVFWACAAHASWVSPSGYSDPGNQWISETRVYDENTATYASNQHAQTGWGQFIVLTLSAAIYCDRVRVNADFMTSITDYVDIDVYRDGAWADAYQGPIANCAWSEAAFTGGQVTQARFRFHYVSGGYYFWLYEFDFWEGVPAIEIPVADTDSATSIEETTAILHGQALDDGGEPCEYRFQYGPTVAYGYETGWSSSLETGTTFGRVVTGLMQGVAYHFRAQLRNSAGVGNGPDLLFSTGAPASGWVSPTGSADPTGDWENDANAYDDELGAYARAYHDINDPDGQWSPFVYLTHAEMTSDRLRFYARGPTADSYYVDQVDVDVHLDGVWADVYQGSFAHRAWVEQTFTQGAVDQARIRFRVNANNAGLYYELYEFDFYRISLQAPTLAWTGETNYESDGLDPETGDRETDFTYRVEYTDADNEAPAWIVVYIDGNGDGDYDDFGESAALNVSAAGDASKHDGDYTNGEWFTVTTTVSYSESASYKFGANDGTFDATGAPTTPVAGPSLIPTISIAVTPSQWDIGGVAVGQTSESPACTLINTGDIAEDFTIRATDGAGGWVLDTAPGLNTFQLEADKGDDGSYELNLTTSDQAFYTDLPAAAEEAFGLRYRAPTSDSLGGGIAHDLTVTVTASESVP